MTASFLFLLLIALFLAVVPSRAQNCTARNCTVCNSTNPSLCLTCNLGYVQVGNGCCKTNMQFCTGCSVDQNVCDGCTNSSLCKLNSTSCVSCSQAMSDCLACSSCTDCTACPSNYLLNASKRCERCDSLMVKCSTCSTSTNCLTCMSGYSKLATKCCLNSLTFCLSCNTNSDQCDTCVSNSYCKINSTGCVTCGSTMNFCLTCSSCTACLTCQANYIVNSTAKCQLCSDIMPKCQTCTSTTACTTCVTGYAKIGVKCCLDPMPFCSGCLSDPNTCDSCISNSYCKINSTGCVACGTPLSQCLTCTSCSACLTCAVNYGLNTTSQCQLCTDLILKCQTCLTSAACTTCITGYAKIGVNCCFNPMPFCSGCLGDPDICDGCTTNSYCLVNSTACHLCKESISSCLTCSNCSFCLTCASTFGIDSSSTCTLCSDMIDNCLTCTSFTNCQTCTNSSFVLNTTLRCDPCVSFMANCETCSSQTVCTQCIDNTFALNTSNKCQPCINFMQFCTHCSNRNFCTACVPSAEVTLSPRNKCEYCPYVISYCLECTSAIHCTECANYYALKQNGTGVNCVSCLSQMARCFNCYNITACKRCTVGAIVQGGCSSVVGCLNVTQSIAGGPCVTCSTQQFLQNAVNDACICKNGYLAGQHCTTIAGCTVADFIPNVNNCRVCDLPKKFLEKNGDCICQLYYEKIGSVCKEICGDGKVIQLACDDGNLIDGDGCSSKCKIEPRYSCKRRQNNGPSKCIYEGNIVLTLLCVYKSAQLNSAEVQLSVNPYISNLQKCDFKNLKLQTSANISLGEVKVQNKQLVLILPYSQNVDGKKVSLRLDFDKNYINSLPQALSFTLNDCKGESLAYQQVPSQFQLLMKDISSSLAILSILIWFLCSFSHKMIGVETINAIQIIVVTQIFSVNYSPNIQYTSGLTAILGGFQNQLVAAQIPKNPILLNRMGYSNDILGNLIFVVILQIISTLLYILVNALRICDLFQGIRKRYNISHHLQRLKQTIYGFLLFPINIGFFLHVIMATILQSQRKILTSVDLQLLQSSLLLFSIVVAGLVFLAQWKYLIVLKSTKGKTYKEYYVSAYLTYILMNTMVVVLAILEDNTYPVHSLAAIQLLYLIFLVIALPYHELLHNITLIIVQIFILLNTSLILTQFYLSIPSRIELILVYVIYGMIGTIDILGLVRAVIFLRKRFNSVVPDVGELRRRQRLKKRKKLDDQTSRQLQSFLKKQANDFMNEVEFQFNRNLLKGEFQFSRRTKKTKALPSARLKYEERRADLGDIQSNDLLKQPLKQKR